MTLSIAVSVDGNSPSSGLNFTEFEVGNIAAEPSVLKNIP